MRLVYKCYSCIYYLCQIKQSSQKKRGTYNVTSSNGNEQQTKAQAIVSMNVKLTNTNKHYSYNVITVSYDEH